MGENGKWKGWTNHSIRTSLKLAKTSVPCQDQSPAHSRVSLSCLPRIVSRQSIPNDRYSTTCLVLSPHTPEKNLFSLPIIRCTLISLVSSRVNKPGCLSPSSCAKGSTLINYMALQWTLQCVHVFLICLVNISYSQLCSPFGTQGLLDTQLSEEIANWKKK